MSPKPQALQKCPILSPNVDVFAAYLPHENLYVYLHNDDISVPIKSISLQTAFLQSNMSMF